MLFQHPVLVPPTCPQRHFCLCSFKILQYLFKILEIGVDVDLCGVEILMTDQLRHLLDPHPFVGQVLAKNE